LYNESCLDAQMRRQIYGDIYDDSMWLIDLVENLLSVTRIEEGRMQIRQSAELVDEVIREALKHTGQSRTGRTIKVEEEDELILAKMDARLIVQVLINLIGNAVKYTPQGTDITVQVKKEKTENSQVIISVCDLGDGIPDDRKERVFDMFYTGGDQVADSRRSLGLGLGLCRSIINAHGGKIWISDNIPHGAVVTFTLPAEEVALNE
ncbi:MAG: sensor histidine kinase, partial [Clostridium sp.]